MARKTPKGKTAPKTAADDTFVAPKISRKPQPKHTTLAEAIAEQAAEEGKDVEEVREELLAPTEAESPVRPAGTSNLACTIRSHRKNYVVMLRGDKKTQNNGDTVAQHLLPLSLDTLKAIAATTFGKSYDHLNPGHARMCIGNLIRGELKKNPAFIEVLQLAQPKAESAE